MLVFLIGFMGCGKSYMGRTVAPKLGFRHIDMDHFIQDSEKMTVQEIFASKGEEYFREKERHFLAQLDPSENILISTGGGAPCFFDNMEVMNVKGVTIFLHRDRKETLKRLMRGLNKRPLLAGKSEKEVGEFYDKKLAERLPFYSKAKLTVTDQTADEVAMIIKALRL